MIDRGEYWQCVYLIAKGVDTALRTAGVEAFRARIAGLIPVDGRPGGYWPHSTRSSC
jgi:hypothetical protein